MTSVTMHIYVADWQLGSQRLRFEVGQQVSIPTRPIETDWPTVVFGRNVVDLAWQAEFTDAALAPGSTLVWMSGAVKQLFAVFAEATVDAHGQFGLPVPGSGQLQPRETTQQASFEPERTREDTKRSYGFILELDKPAAD